jgi:hypothetical protein
MILSVECILAHQCVHSYNPPATLVPAAWLLFWPSRRALLRHCSCVGCSCGQHCNCSWPLTCKHYVRRRQSSQTIHNASSCVVVELAHIRANTTYPKTNSDATHFRILNAHQRIDASICTHADCCLTQGVMRHSCSIHADLLPPPVQVTLNVMS